MGKYVTVKRAKNTQLIFQYANEGISLWNRNESISGINIYRFKHILFILSDLLNVNGSIHKEEIKRNIIWNGLKRYNKYKIKNYNYLMRALNKQFSVYFNRPKNLYRIVFTSNIKYDWIKNKRHITINNHKFMIRNFNQISKKYDLSFLNSSLPLKGIYPKDTQFQRSMHNYTYFEAEMHKPSTGEAQHYLFRQFETLRAFINFTLIYNITSFHRGPPRALSPIGPPRYIWIFNDDNEYLEYYYCVLNDRHYKEYRPGTYGLEYLNGIYKNVRKYNSLQKSKLFNKISDCFNLYNLAIDNVEKHHSLLYFWQILENIYSIRGDNYDTIKRRIKNFFKNNDKLSYIIEICCEKRNKLVHSGEINHIGEEDINNIKQLVDASLNVLLYTADKYRNIPELMYFYDNLTSEQSLLKRKISILRRIDNLP